MEKASGFDHITRNCHVVMKNIHNYLTTRIDTDALNNFILKNYIIGLRLNSWALKWCACT